jgi:hypothetical protein
MALTTTRAGRGVRESAYKIAMLSASALGRPATRGSVQVGVPTRLRTALHRRFIVAVMPTAMQCATVGEPISRSGEIPYHEGNSEGGGESCCYWSTNVGHSSRTSLGAGCCARPSLLGRMVQGTLFSYHWRRSAWDLCCAWVYLCPPGTRQGAVRPKCAAMDHSEPFNRSLGLRVRCCAYRGGVLAACPTATHEPCDMYLSRHRRSPPTRRQKST